MAKYDNFIAAIDLGTSHIIGIVGNRDENNLLKIIAYESESSDNAIRRGGVYNIEDTANKVSRLIKKLENKLQGAKIKKIYVGFGGQSLRTIRHKVSRDIGAEGIVTDEIVGAMKEECREYIPNFAQVLSITSPEYYLNEIAEKNPIGVSTQRIDAFYKLIIGRPIIKTNINKSIQDRAHIEIEDVLITPIALGEAVLSDSQKELGCVLIDMGAGVTSVSVYKENLLKNLVIIPFGGLSMTRDLTSLQITIDEAELIKKNYGNVDPEAVHDRVIKLNAVDGTKDKEVKLDVINMIIETRLKEIIDNVYDIVDKTIPISSLGAGVIVTGGCSELKGFNDFIRKKFKTTVQTGLIRRDLIAEDYDIAGNPAFIPAVSLILQGQKNCCEAEKKVDFIHEESKGKAEGKIKKAKEKKESKASSKFSQIMDSLFNS